MNKMLTESLDQQHPHFAISRDGLTGEVCLEPTDQDVPKVRGAAGLAGIPGAPELSHHQLLQAMRSGEIGSIHSWETVTAVDGPGTRITVFFAGCPLRCLYCHNPDTLKMREGTLVRTEDLLKHLKRYRAIFRASGGGVTFSGGEPMMQSAFLQRLLTGCKELGIHTTIDVTGFLGANATSEILDNLDLVLLDVKSGDEETYHRVTGRALAPTLKFGQTLSDRGIAIWVRFVLVPGLTDASENIERVAQIASQWKTVQRVEVLPFHQMARDKWHELHLTYQLEKTPTPTKDQVKQAQEIFRNHGFEVY